MTTDPPPDPTSDAALNDAAIAVALSGRPYEIADLWELPGNPHDGDDRAVAESLARFGQVKPIAVSADGCVIAGNTTFRAARDLLGWSRIAGVEMTHEEAEAKAYALADNRTAQLGRDDPERMVAFFGEVEDWTGIGWDEDARADMEFAASIAADEATAAGQLQPVESDIDDLEPPPAPVSKPLDVWELGPHKLVCGDSTDRNVVDRVLDGPVAMVWTDPPFGIGYQAMRGGKKIANDGTPEAAEAVTTDALTVVDLAEGAAVFVCADWRSLSTMIAAITAAGLTPKATIVWDKCSRVQNLDRFAKRYELILYAGPYGGQPTVDDDVWSVPRDFRPEHVTPKPVPLVSRAIRHASARGDVVFDPFAGSGSTLIACHEYGRVARLIELDPGYCDVIARRYQRVTGIVPVLNGQPVDFEEMAA